jgi:tRNA 2-thiouridine synthesizing protein A
MSSQVDARGLSCPQPVVLTQKAIREGKASFEVLVSNVVSKENVIRCVQNNKMKAEVVENGDEFKIIVSK